jgi:protoporphyrinogen oxidase
MTLPEHTDFLVIGAGPAGLTAALELCRHGYRPLVIEAGDTVGGIARTENHQGNRVDIGGHRYYSKDPAVTALWHDLLPHDMRTVRRLSRIHYRSGFLPYPLELLPTLRHLGLRESIAILASYLGARLRPIRPEVSFADWVSNRFGRRLYRAFFQTYTEKVWGIPCSEIRADWAAQRIPGLSLTSAVLGSLRRATKVRTLTRTFAYPNLGPGQMWEAAADRIAKNGGQVVLRAEAGRILTRDGRIESVVVKTPHGQRTIRTGAVLSSQPLSALVEHLTPSPGPALASARALKYRDFLIVTLEIAREHIFPDNWIYIHSPEVQVGRVQNFKNWSAALLADSRTTTLGMEYFCNVGDPLWSLGNAELGHLAAREAATLGFCRADEVRHAFVIRQRKAYPVYDEHYRHHVDTLHSFVRGFTNLETIGRNGLHRYNNMDHSMLSGLAGARRLLGLGGDPWEVNLERSNYEEQVVAHSSKPVPPSGLPPQQ